MKTMYLVIGIDGEDKFHFMGVFNDKKKAEYFCNETDKELEEMGVFDCSSYVEDVYLRD